MKKLIISQLSILLLVFSCILLLLSCSKSRDNSPPASNTNNNSNPVSGPLTATVGSNNIAFTVQIATLSQIGLMEIQGVYSSGNTAYKLTLYGYVPYGPCTSALNGSDPGDIEVGSTSYSTGNSPDIGTLTITSFNSISVNEASVTGTFSFIAGQVNPVGAGSQTITNGKINDVDLNVQP